MKDPAFLFYSKDFYEGTRLMTLEERGCYVDLLIYQHQNGYIPTDLKRVVMYCSGSTEAMLIATLEAKFKLCDKGYYNEKLKIVIEDRLAFSQKQSINGVVGQFWKKAKLLLSNKNYISFKKVLNNESNTEIFEQIKNLEINKAMLEAMLQAKLKQYAIANAIAIEDENKNDIGILKNKDSDLEIFPEQLENVFKEFLEMRKRIKKPATEKAISLLRKKLKQLSDSSQKKAIEILNQSIVNNWQDLYQLKQDNHNAKPITNRTNTTDAYDQFSQKLRSLTTTGMD